MRGLLAALIGGCLGWLIADGFTSGHAVNGAIALAALIAFWGYMFSR